ncbi:MAG: NAD(P)/FAD-dependent oxidoreductase [Oscillospiraceae bacterium]|nr:NAD(P)/FAD-dependent oxidoreductase [Oscillospiraceae bacterium]
MVYDVIVIGAGVVGCATAMELGRLDVKAAVLERDDDVCTGASKANSAIVHAGFDPVPGTLMAKYNVLGSRKMRALCRELDVPFNMCGSLVLCFDREDMPRLQALLDRGVTNGVEGLRIVEGEELRALEPNVSPEAVAALWAPTSAILCPFELTAAMAENAARNGVAFFFNSGVTGIERREDRWVLTTPAGVFEARAVVNAAGICSDELHNAVGGAPLTIRGRRGEYCLLDRKVGSLVRTTIFQLPGRLGKGVLVSPTVHGNIIVGPTADDVDDKRATETTAKGISSLLSAARRSVPSLPRGKTVTSFAGLRAHLVREEHDFVLGPVDGAPGFFDAVGIESPGLTAAPALGEYLAGLCGNYLNAAPRGDYRPGRDRVVRLREMSFEERAALVAENPAYGQIVCRCEGVTEGEIVDAIRRSPGARSVDGVKRRTRAGMGRCQGGFCLPRVLEILSRELGVPMTELTKDGGAPLLTGSLREEGEA